MIRLLWYIVLVVFTYSCKKQTQIVIETPLGDVICIIYEHEAPVTAANFLKYIDDKRYDASCFYRVVTMDNQTNIDCKIEVIQGGLYNEDHPLMLPSIAHESTKQTGLHHVDGTLSMARYQPGTASSEFFICIGDQPELDHGGRRNSDGQGFAAFGRVIKGMDVVRNIQLLKNNEQMLDEKVPIIRMRRQ